MCIRHNAISENIPSNNKKRQKPLAEVYYVVFNGAVKCSPSFLIIFTIKRDLRIITFLGKIM